MSGSKLGIGLLYNPALPQFLETQPGSFDYLELIPDREWADRGVNSTPRYSFLDKSLEFLHRLREQKPMLCHSVGLSIGSATIFDTGHIEQIRWMHEQFDFAWHSDHLSFSRLPEATAAATDKREMHTAISLPVPYDQEVLELIAGRVRQIRSVIDSEFLLENNVYYAETPEQEMSEPEFLNRLCRDSGCGILLDLHNLYVNARNHGVSAEYFLHDLDLRNVVEIHLAGGDDLLGFYTDSHAGPVAEPVWDLLQDTLQAAPWIRGVTFEFHESSYPLLKMDGIRAQLERARRIWERYC
jgi:uncharacterized protein (UPF0276 family)